MTDAVKKLLKDGCIEGAGEYFLEFKKKYPTYDLIKKAYFETESGKEQLRIIRNDGRH